MNFNFMVIHLVLLLVLKCDSSSFCEVFDKISSDSVARSLCNSSGHDINIGTGDYIAGVIIFYET